MKTECCKQKACKFIGGSGCADFLVAFFAKKIVG